MDHRQDVDLGGCHTLGYDVGRAGDDQLTRPGDPAWPTHVWVVAQLSNPALDPIAHVPGCARIVLEDELKDVLEIALGLAAPDEVHQPADFRRSSMRARSRANTSSCGTPSTPLSASPRARLICSTCQ